MTRPWPVAAGPSSPLRAHGDLGQPVCRGHVRGDRACGRVTVWGRRASGRWREAGPGAPSPHPSHRAGGGWSAPCPGPARCRRTVLVGRGSESQPMMRSGEAGEEKRKGRARKTSFGEEQKVRSARLWLPRFAAVPTGSWRASRCPVPGFVSPHCVQDAPRFRSGGSRGFTAGLGWGQCDRRGEGEARRCSDPGTAVL